MKKLTFLAFIGITSIAFGQKRNTLSLSFFPKDLDSTQFEIDFNSKTIKGMILKKGIIIYSKSFLLTKENLNKANIIKKTFLVNVKSGSNLSKDQIKIAAIKFHRKNDTSEIILTSIDETYVVTQFIDPFLNIIKDQILDRNFNLTYCFYHTQRQLLLSKSVIEDSSKLQKCPKLISKFNDDISEDSIASNYLLNFNSSSINCIDIRYSIFNIRGLIGLIKLSIEKNIWLVDGNRTAHFVNRIQKLNTIKNLPEEPTDKIYLEIYSINKKTIDEFIVSKSWIFVPE